MTKKHFSNTEKINETCKMEQALAKQIKQKLDYEADGYDDNGNLLYDIARCPICQHEFEYEIGDWGSAYCQDCGQALDWEN